MRGKNKGYDDKEEEYGGEQAEEAAQVAREGAYRRDRSALGHEGHMFHQARPIRNIGYGDGAVSCCSRTRRTGTVTFVRVMKRLGEVAPPHE